ncbi:MAG: M18 family aminopeptidase, partial [Holdemanella sp.]|nr:M18 family aminopeptidase [Holdemanella sp.]MCF0239301.1 M18 family aminopeptidase [Streptococcus gallolyticus]
YMNHGPVIKESANPKYTTDAFSRAVFAGLAQKANVPVQVFANRSDITGGSTLGNLSNTQVSVHSVDMGLPQLAMHSSYETAGVKDTGYAIQLLEAFYGTNIVIEEADQIEFE